ncbi:transposase InsO family protein [Bradyrhizobium yuanmingense]
MSLVLRRPLESAQYASHAYREVLTGAGIVASMSRKADCYDNAPMESFFHTLKGELVHHRDYDTRAEAQRDIFAFIEGFYNRTRLHSAIGHVAPIEMELKAAYPSTFSGEDHIKQGNTLESRGLAIGSSPPS